MGLRTKAYFIGACLTFFSSMAAALGLGEIKLNSALNQPLNAEIQLLHVRDLTAREILVSLASPAEFERAGVERNFFVTGLKFDVDLGAAQGPVVRVTSDQPVREPFLNFIVTAQWPSGKLLREYTLLVDLPIFSGSRAAPVQAAPNQGPATTEQTRPATPRVPPPRTQAPVTTDDVAKQPAYASDTYGPVGANENLWSIASKIKPDSSVSVQQTMLAIQRLNPEAFINNNINLLRRGQVLRIPDKQEIQSLTGRQAMREVAEQNNRWNNRAAVSDKAQLEGSKSFSQTREETSGVEGRIKLSSPATSGESGQGAGVDGGEQGGQVAEALAQAQEELDAADRENSDLKSRLQSMEEQIQTMEKLVEVSNEEMRALEIAAQQTNQAAEQVPPEQPVADQPAQDGEAETTEPQSTPEQAVTPAAPPEQAPSKPAKSWMDLIMENILYIGIGVGVLVLALAAFLYMRRRDDGFEEDFEDDFGRDVNGDFDVPDAAAFDEDDKTVPLYGSDTGDEPFDEPVLAEAETEDVVGECDIHIAYGQYDQAEEKLVRALEKDPANVPVRLKLMEVFAAQGDADSFDYHYARLQRVGDAESLDRAAILRSSIDAAGEFDADAYDTSDMAGLAATASSGTARASAFSNSEDTSDELNFADDTLAFDFNEADDLADPSKQKSAANETTVDDLDFDLQLDEESEDVTRVPSRVKEEPSAEEFDTDLGDLEFELGDLDADASEQDFNLDEELGSAATESKELAAEDELNFDFERGDDLATGSFDDLEDSLLTDEQLTQEFAENRVSEPSSADFATDFDAQGLEFADLDMGLEPRDDTLDFDLDRDLESAKSVSERAPLLTDESDDDAGLTELGLEDLEDLDIDLDSGKGPATTTSGHAAADSISDFDVDFDLDGDVNLDALDHELDALASDFSAAPTTMEEPVTDFDELNETVTEAEALESEQSEPAALDLDDALVTEEEIHRKPEKLSGLSFKTPVSSAEAANSSLDFEIPDFDPENDDDSNLDFLSDNDETATKLDLARAYIDMGDSDGAKDILDEILDEGNDQQKREAEALLARIG